MANKTSTSFEFLGQNSEDINNTVDNSKTTKKTRSKVWEKVAWFTRKTKTGKENKNNSPRETRKDCKSPVLRRTRHAKEDCLQLEYNSVGPPSSPNLTKTKSKSGVKKARSFYYLKRKKYSVNTEYTKGEIMENECSKATATGTFYDFESTGRRSSRTTSASCCSVLNEMAREVNTKQPTHGKESTKSSLSLPMSLLSIGENESNEINRNTARTYALQVRTLGPMYNSWPRKKRNYRTNHYNEAFSPPQKQKRMCTLRKTATFSGFDKLTDQVMRDVKSSPSLDQQDNQIKNQNGLTIGVVHFFKSPSNATFNSGCNTSIAECNMARNNMSFNSETSDDASGNTSYNADDGKLSINATANLCQFIEAKENWTGEQLELFSPDLITGFINHKSSNLADNLDFRLDSRECLEYTCTRPADDCPGYFKDIVLAHSGDSKLHLETTASCKSCRTENHLDIICEISDGLIDDDCKFVHSNDTAKYICDTETDIKCANCLTSIQEDNETTSKRTSTDDSKPLCDITNIDTKSRCDCSTQDIVSPSLSTLSSYDEFDFESTEKDCLASNKTPNDDHLVCDVGIKVITTEDDLLDTNVYCIQIEDQTTDFSHKEDDHKTDVKLLPQIAITNPEEEEEAEVCLMKETKGINDINKSLTDLKNNTSNTDNLKEEVVLDDSLLSSAKEVVPVEDDDPCYSDSSKSDGSQVDFNNGFDITSVQLYGKALLKEKPPSVNGQQFKQQTENMMDWFSNFNNEQKNIFLRRLLEKCELPQMHMLSVIMEPVLHKTCPSNCQDMLAWLPHPVIDNILFYLDPVSLCRCSQVNRFWNSLASSPWIWKRLCRSSEWQLSRNAAKIHSTKYTLQSGTVEWKKMFAERYLLRHNWLNGRCRVRTFEGHTQGISCVQFDDTRIVSGSSDKTIKVWDLSRDDSHAVLTLAGHSGTVRCLNLNGNRLVSGSVDKSIKVWDLSFESYWSGASCKVTMVGHMHTVRCLQVDDQKVVSGSYDKTLKVWDIKTGHCKLTLRGHNAAVLCVQFDDSKIVSGSYDNTIKVWSLQEGECLMTLTGHHDAVTCLNLTQDGRKVISGSLDHNLKFWDLATGKCIGTLDWIRSEGHTGVIRCLQSDSWRIVSAGDDKTLKMWSLETGQRLLTLRCHTDGVTCLQFNDYAIVSGSYDKTVKVWTFTPEHEFLNST